MVPTLEKNKEGGVTSLRPVWVVGHAPISHYLRKNEHNRVRVGSILILPVIAELCPGFIKN